MRRLLAAGHAVSATTRPGAATSWRLRDVEDDLRLHAVDLADPAAAAAVVAATAPDWVFHLAAHGAYSWQDDVGRILAVDVQGTAALVDAAAACGVSAFVHAGSSSEYGFKDHPAREDERVDPNSAYAVGKAAATSYVRYVGLRDGLRYSTLRLYSIYGPWEEPARLMPRLVGAALRGGLPPLVAPDTARDFVYVDDACSAFLRAAELESLAPGAVVNIASGRQVTLRELVDVARAAFAIEVEPRWGTTPARAWDTNVWVGDTRRAAEQLGWRAETPLRAGLVALAEWLSAEPERLRRYQDA